MVMVSISKDVIDHEQILNLQLGKNTGRMKLVVLIVIGVGWFLGKNIIYLVLGRKCSHNFDSEKCYLNLRGVA